MAILQEFTFPSSDGLHQVHAMEWLPESGAPKAVEIGRASCRERV